MYEILGWYTVGTAVTELDLGIQRQVRRARLNRAMFTVCFDAVSESAARIMNT